MRTNHTQSSKRFPSHLLRFLNNPTNENRRKKTSLTVSDLIGFKIDAVRERKTERRKSKPSTSKVSEILTKCGRGKWGPLVDVHGVASSVPDRGFQPGDKGREREKREIAEGAEQRRVGHTRCHCQDLSGAEQTSIGQIVTGA